MDDRCKNCVWLNRDCDRPVCPFPYCIKKFTPAETKGRAEINSCGKDKISYLDRKAVMGACGKD